jgi:hypothetical protein
MHGVPAALDISPPSSHDLILMCSVFSRFQGTERRPRKGCARKQLAEPPAAETGIEDGSPARGQCGVRNFLHAEGVQYGSNARIGTPAGQSFMADSRLQ